jgi:hypothetical protein
MVNLTYGENELLLTGTENITDPNITTLNQAWFGIYSQVTKVTKWVKLVNQSLYLPRCDNFTMTIVSNIGSESLLEGIVYLKEKGFYEYSLYTNTGGESPSENDTLLERGKCLLEFSDATITSYDPNIEVIVYDRE